MVQIHTCKVDKTPLILKQTRRSAEQLKKKYYYTAYYFCPICKRNYFDDEFKIINHNFDLFTSHTVIAPRDVDIEIWTDGASSNNGRDNAKAAWAFVAGEYEEAGRVDGKQTNNRGEALAIFHALKWAADKGYKNIRLHTDSQITLHGVAKDPAKVKENRDIFQRIHEVVAKNDLQVDYQKVLGHAGDPNNERADRLAVRFSLQ
ncbi:MAG TPA: RNase H family protein [Patescibacteria group bacterium]|nr:RNase H family protein [Patescibacteria group bacterium]